MEQRTNPLPPYFLSCILILKVTCGFLPKKIVISKILKMIPKYNMKVSMSPQLQPKLRLHQIQVVSTTIDCNFPPYQELQWSMDTDTDTGIIWENHIIQCNYVSASCRTRQQMDIPNPRSVRASYLQAI